MHAHKKYLEFMHIREILSTDIQPGAVIYTAVQTAYRRVFKGSVCSPLYGTMNFENPIFPHYVCVAHASVSIGKITVCHYPRISYLPDFTV